MDYVQLKGIDLFSLFVCLCKEPYSCVAFDGTAISFALAAMKLYCADVIRGEQEAVQGSAYRTRMILPNREDRALLESFTKTASPDTQAWSEEDFADLVNTMGMRNNALAFFVIEVGMSTETEVSGSVRF